METIGVATLAGKGKEIRPEKLKAIDIEESTEGMKAGPEAKKEKDWEILETIGVSGGKGSQATFGYKDPEEDQGRVFFFAGSCDFFSPWSFGIL